jgi:hypothetical protein
VRGDPVKVLRARHDADGLHLHARTATAGWLGERLDVGWAIDVLHPLATRPPLPWHDGDAFGRRTTSVESGARA